MKYYYIFIASLLPFTTFAEKLGTGIKTKDPLIKENTANGWSLVEALGFVESFLLKVVLPLVVIGTFLYVAYELLTAEGNEEKMKKAWKSVTFSVIGIIVITLAYAIIAMASRLSL